MTRETKQKILDWGFIAAMVSSSLILLGWLWVLIISATSTVGQVEANTAHLDDHEQRVRLVEHDLQEIRSDLRWIRLHLEERLR